MVRIFSLQAASLVSFVVTVSLSCAQTPKPISPVKQQVTVTAARTALGTNVTASSVRTLTEQDLQEAPAFTLDDRLRQIPGVELYRRTSGWIANPTTQGISLRGLGSTAASRTLVVSDQVPLNDPFGGWIHWNEIPALAIDRVEVLRGGASDLYGSSAVGGVIDVVPVRTGDVRRIVQIGGGGLGTVSGDGILSGARGGWSGLGAASVLHTDGYITVAPEQRGAVDRASGVTGKAGRLEIRRGDAERGVFLRGNLLDESRQNGTQIQTNSTHLWRYQAGGDAVAGRSRFFARLFGSDQSYHQSFSSITSGRASESLNRLQTVPSQELGAAAQWAASWNEITAVAGVDVRDVRATNVEAQYANGTPGAVTNITARQRASGGYGELLWQHGPWSAALSGRVDDFRTFDAKKYVDGVLTHLARTDEVVFNPRLGVVRKFGKGVSVSGSVFRAFRGPTLNELYRSSQVGQQLTLPNDSLRSERATGFEFGAQKDMRAGTVRGSYFWTEVNRPVSAVLIVDQKYQRENLGQIRSRGVSMDFVTRPASFLQLSGGYQLAIATVTQFQPNPSLVGNWIPEVARHAATLQLRAEHRRIGVLNLQGRQSGRLYDNSENTAVLHGFFRMDLEAERTFARRWDFAVTVQNLLDRRIEAGRTPTLTLATPRVVTVSLRLHRSR